jgi:hypothetical protein
MDAFETIFEQAGITNLKIREGIVEAWRLLNNAGLHISIYTLINAVREPRWIGKEYKLPTGDEIEDIKPDGSDTQSP